MRPSNARRISSSLHRRRNMRLERLENRHLLAGVTDGVETLVNTYTSGTQTTRAETRAVAGNAAGEFAVVFDGQGPGGFQEIFLRRYDSSGSPIGSQSLVNVTTNSNQRYASVAMGSAGETVVGWSGVGAGDNDGGVFVRLFDNTGTPVSGEIKVSQTVPSNQQKPVVAKSPADGSFIVTWSGNGSGDTVGVFARRYASNGVPLTGEFLVNTTTMVNQQNPDIAIAPDGSFVVAWDGTGPGDAAGVFFQRFSSSGTPVGAETRANTTTLGNQTQPSVGIDGANNFTVVWSGRGSGDNGGVFLQRYNASGSPIGSEEMVNTTTLYDQHEAKIAMPPSGAPVITWSSLYQDGSSRGVFLQEYDASGAKDGGEVQVNTTTFLDQRFSSVAMRGESRFTVAWSGRGDGDTQGVFVQSYTRSTASPPTAIDDSYTSLGNVGLDVPEAAGLILGSGTDLDGGGTITVSAVQGIGANVGTPTETDAVGLGGAKGSVTVASDGSFTYEPPPGFNGDDTFTYQIENTAGTDTGTVTITVDDMIWFIDNASTGSNRGTLDNPFTSITSFNSAQGAALPSVIPGDTIFVAAGGSDYTDGISLQSDQLLLGEAAGVSIETAGSHTPPIYSRTLPSTGGTAPVLTDTSSGQNAIDVATDNTIRGLDIGNTGGTGINGADVGSLFVREVGISGDGGGVELGAPVSATIDVVLDSLSATSSTDEGIRLSSLNGSFSVTDTSGVISTTDKPAVNITGGLTINAEFASISSTGPNTGISLVNANGSLMAHGGSITSANVVSVIANGGTADLTYDGSVTQTSGASAFLIANRSGGTLDFGGSVTAHTNAAKAIDLKNNGGATVRFGGTLDLNTSSGVGFSATGGGIVEVTDSGNSVDTGTGSVLVLDGVTPGAGGLAFSSLTRTTGSSTPAIVFDSVGSGTVDVGVADVAGSGIDIVGTTSATFTFSDLDISLSAAGQTGVDAVGATINGSLVATDFDLTSSSTSATIGVDLSGTTGTGSIVLGDTSLPYLTGEDASIAGTSVGVEFSPATNFDFTFGDGEATADVGSSITATTPIDTLPGSGSYNFLDVTLITIPSPPGPFAPPNDAALLQLQGEDDLFGSLF